MLTKKMRRLTLLQQIGQRLNRQWIHPIYSIPNIQASFYNTRIVFPKTEQLNYTKNQVINMVSRDKLLLFRKGGHNMQTKSLHNLLHLYGLSSNSAKHPLQLYYYIPFQAVQL